MSGRLRLFEAWGIELEYMIVDRETLDVRPIADELLADVAGEITGDVEFGPVSWSNELVLHVIEFKCTEPLAHLAPLADLFQQSVAEADRRLARFGARLLPTAMHPWMDPLTETRLWPHDYNVVYEAFDRIFGCRGHGWSNLQSMHVNLPFGDDESAGGEFGRLHAAIRLVLPILPALAASSPFVEGRATPILDNRLEFYRNNSRKIPAICAEVIPEPAFTRADYERRILAAIYAAVAPHDPAGVLREEWANARGAIARFDRDAIEIRVLDLQECPRADLAVAALSGAVIRALSEGRWADTGSQQRWEVAPLAKVFLACLREGERAVIDDPAYLLLFGCGEARVTAGDLWAHLRRTLWRAGDADERAFGGALDVILRAGTLASRLRRAAGEAPGRERLREVYRQAADALSAGEMFEP